MSTAEGGRHCTMLLLLKSFLIFLVLLQGTFVHSRTLYHSQTSGLISDGVATYHAGRHVPLAVFSASDGASQVEYCDQTYGFMPCSTTAIGNLFLIIVYGYLMFLAATYLSNGSELLLEILGPGIIGGLFLPILGALPDAMLILVSGFSGSIAMAQNQVSVGMGLLAGSTIMLLTIIWGSCIIVGKCDIREANSLAIDTQNTKGFCPTGTGVSTDIWTCYAARIMAISVVPFLIVQLPQLLHSTSGRHFAVLISLIVSLLMLLSYCLYQVFQPWIQRRRIAYSKHKHVISGILKHLKKRSLGRLLTDEGDVNQEILEKLFRTIDENKDNYLSASELRALVIGIQFEEINLDKEDAICKLMEDFDTSKDNLIDLGEFIHGVSRWLGKAKKAGAASANAHFGTMKFLSNFHEETKREHTLLGSEEREEGGDSDEAEQSVENPRWTSFKAALLLLFGTSIAAVVADPLVDAVGNFSSATGIPSFFISFVALPMATNSGEAVSAVIFASRKKLRTTSLAFSELYGAVTMNNLLCLSVFLALVYARGLTWDFSSEVLIILIVCLVMAAIASFQSTFPLWMAAVSFLLYPFSLALVYVLDYLYGWS